MTRLLPMAHLALAAAIALCACSDTTDTASTEADAGLADAAVLTADADIDAPDARPADGGGAGAPEGDASQVEDPMPLAIEGILPARGPTSGKTALVLSGSGFFKSFTSGASTAQAQTRLFIGEREATDLAVINDLRIEALTPAAPEAGTGAVDVVLQNPAGEARCEGCFTYYAPLALEAIAPARGSTSGGQWVELRGAGFDGALTVLFGETPAPQVELVSEERARVLTPPATAAGPVSIQAFNKNGMSERMDGFTYEAPLALDAIAPRAVPLNGGVEVALTGQALDLVEVLRVDKHPVDFARQSTTELSFWAPPMAEAGSAALVAETAEGLQAKLDGGLLYVDPNFDPAASDGPPFQISGIWPTHGPARGGQAVSAAGSALDRVTAIAIDGVPLDRAAWSVADGGQRLVLNMPPGPAGHSVTLRFQGQDSSAQALERTYRYDVRLDGVTPRQGQAQGGEWVALAGEGFMASSPLAVRFGAAVVRDEGALICQNDTELRVKTPAGRGIADVAIFEVADASNADALAEAFTFIEPLSIAAISPASGTVAGGDEVAVYGTGFAPGIGILFGNSALRDVTVVSPSRLTGRVPQGSPGAVDVAVRLGMSSDTLIGGYVYRDTSANLGGSSGAALAGTLNITAFLDSTTRIAGVRVSASADGGATTLASGQTNADGQLTLQSSGFDRPLRVTFEKAGFQTLIVENQSAANLSVFMTQISTFGTPGSSGTTPSGSSEADPSAIPSGSTAAGGATIAPEYGSGALTPVISGTVTGFKLPRELGANEMAMAEVWTVPTSYYSTPPFGSAATPAIRDARGERWRVTSDGGPFTIYGAQGRQSLYALFGIYDTEAQFLTPHLMGLLRGIAVSAATPAVNLSLRLDMHLDQSLPITVLPAPAALDPDDEEEAGRILTHALYAWLALGNDGYVAFGPATGQGASLELTGLPRLDAQSFLFLNRSLAADGKFSSFCFQRTWGELGSGLAIGPMLGRLIPIAPDAGAAQAGDERDTAGEPGEPTSPESEALAFDGTIRWRFEGGSSSDILRLYISIFHGNGASDSLEAILPGHATSFALPAALTAAIDPEVDAINVSFQASRAPRFDYDFWSYSHFSTASLTCWASGSFEVPLRREVALPSDGPSGE